MSLTIEGSVLGLVPARGGSKGVPGKNLRTLGGRPLLAYAADVGIRAGVTDRLVLSTDSQDIAHVGRGVGLEVPFMRPAELAADETPMGDVIRHALDWFLAEESWCPEVVILLQPTSPLRRARHLVDALTILKVTGCDAVASVVSVPLHLSPDCMSRIEDGRLVAFLPEGTTVTRRQDARRAYSRDGTVYVFRSEAFRESGSIFGNDCRPLVIDRGASVTIDTLEDWEAAERILRDRAR